MRTDLAEYRLTVFQTEEGIGAELDGMIRHEAGPTVEELKDLGDKLCTMTMSVYAGGIKEGDVVVMVANNVVG